MKSYNPLLVALSGTFIIGVIIIYAATRPRHDSGQPAPVQPSRNEESKKNSPRSARKAPDMTGDDVEALLPANGAPPSERVVSKHQPPEEDPDPPDPLFGSPVEKKKKSAEGSQSTANVPTLDAGKWGLERAVNGLVMPVAGWELLALPREATHKVVEVASGPWSFGQEIDNMQTMLRKFERGLPVLAKKDPVQPNISLRVSEARLKLSNEFDQEMSIVVNGVGYRLAPGSSRVVTVEPGKYTFQVLQLQTEPQHREIAAGEERPLRIYDRR